MSLEIFFTKSSIKELSSIDKESAIIIKEKILKLSDNPKPQGFKILGGVPVIELELEIIE